MKFPNGFGSIVKKGGNRRKPYEVRKTIDGKQRVLGYYATQEEALVFLINYNKAPNTVLSPQKITFSELYKLMTAEKFEKISVGSQSTYKSAYNHCGPIQEKIFCSLHLFDLQSIIRTMSSEGITYASQKKCRQLFHEMYKYAIKYELMPTNSDISKFVDIDKHVTVVKKSPFNTRQLNRVRKLDDKWRETVEILCYTGLRCSELLGLKKADIKLRQKYFIVKESKTEAGRNRLVPIHPAIQGIFERWYKESKTYLLEDEPGVKLDYKGYRKHFDSVMEAAKCKHTPHECRHTLATWLNNAGANETAIKKILGHACDGVTEKVYTHKGIAELRKAMNAIK